MAMKLNTQQMGLQGLLKEGVKHIQGTEDAVVRNINACKALSEITKSSFGPNGLNKLVVNNLEKLFITNDAGTIMREIEVEHPAAKLVWMASQQQEKEWGDATNLVVILAGELLTCAENLLRIGIKPPLIVEGYEYAFKKALELIDSDAFEVGNVNIDGDEHSSKESTVGIFPALCSVIGSKLSGYEEFLARLIIDAKMIAHPSNKSSVNFEPDNVRCAKILGGSINQSFVIPGLVLEREPFGRIHSADNAKVAVFACPINTSRTETKGTVLIKGAADLLSFSKGEEDILKSQIEAIAASGVKVIVSGDTIGELAMHFIERAGMMALKVPSKFELRRLCKAVGATPLARLGAPTAEEAGFCYRVETMEIGGTKCTVFRQDDPNKSRLATIVLRSNTQSLLDDIERAIEDALFTLRNLSKTDGKVCAGAGAFEMELSKKLREVAETTPGVAQYAISKYAEAFEVITRILSDNSGFDSTQCVAKLYSAHQKYPRASIDIESGEVVEETKIIDLIAVKRNAIRLATEVALTVLRVDQIIMSKPAGGPKPRPAGPQDADD